MSDAAVKAISAIPADRRLPMKGNGYSLGTFDARHILKTITSDAASAGGHRRV